MKCTDIISEKNASVLGDMLQRVSMNIFKSGAARVSVSAALAMAAVVPALATTYGCWSTPPTHHYCRNYGYSNIVGFSCGSVIYCPSVFTQAQVYGCPISVVVCS